MRDDFPTSVKETLAKRVGMLCSNPDCRKLTSGPRNDPAKSLSIGVAAHITAAAPCGPRYDVTLSAVERVAITNGIWLCQNCASMIDRDVTRYTVTLLREWKQRAEDKARQGIESSHARGDIGSVTQGVPALKRRWFQYGKKIKWVAFLTAVFIAIKWGAEFANSVADLYQKFSSVHTVTKPGLSSTPFSIAQQLTTNRISITVGKSGRVFLTPQRPGVTNFNGCLSVYLVDTNVMVDCDLFTGEIHGMIRSNEVKYLTGSFQINKNEIAYEIVDGNLNPVFQFLKTGEAEFVVRGLFQTREGNPPKQSVRVVDFDETRLVSWPEVFTNRPSLGARRIFKYPALKYPGKLIEDSN